MCYHPKTTKTFEKDLKRLKKQGKEKSLMEEVMKKIINKIPLEAKYKNHPLKGDWVGSYDCHIKPDWLLIYRIDKKNNAVIFERTGSHSELFNK